MMRPRFDECQRVEQIISASIAKLFTGSAFKFDLDLFPEKVCAAVDGGGDFAIGQTDARKTARLVGLAGRDAWANEAGGGTGGG